jgi:ubiquinol-cytochrome c reductase cytochrome c1 subunit
MRSLKSLALAAGLLVGFGTAPAKAAGEHGPPKLPEVNFPFQGMFGHYDYAALQRGFGVYKQVCANCHGMRLLSYRDLRQIGFSEAQVAAIASTVQVQDGPNDEGQMFERPARPADRFKSPFANERAARAALSR